MKTYYPYIDVAKGVGIMAVIMAHCSNFIFNSEENLISMVIPTFFMSLFFLASGFVSTRAWKERVHLKDLIMAKNYYLLIPFFVFGTVYTMITDFVKNGMITENPLVSLLSGHPNNGYWFILVLVLFRISVLFGKILAQFTEQYCIAFRNLLKYKYFMICLVSLFSMLIGGGFC